MLHSSIYRIFTICIAILFFFSGFSIASFDDNSDFNPDIKADPEQFIETSEQPFDEIMSMRTPTTKFYDTGNGELSAKIWIKPIHFENENGELQDFETSFCALTDSDYDIGVTQNSLKTSFDIDYTGGTKSPVKYESRNGAWLTWQPGQKQLVDIRDQTVNSAQPLSTQPVLGQVDYENSPHIIEYRNTYEGVSEFYTMSTGKIKHEYVLENIDAVGSTRTASGNPAYYGLAFSGTLEFSDELRPYLEKEPLYESDETLTTSSGIYFKCRTTGEIEHYLPAPYAYELNDPTEGVQSSYTIDNYGKNRMTLSVLTPLSWLLDDSREYPIAVDPNDDIYTVKPGPSDGQDTFIADSGTSTLDIYNFGSDHDFMITLDSSGGFVPIRPLLKFDLTSLPQGGNLMEAHLKMDFWKDDEGDYTSMTINAYPLTRSWIEGTGTWTPFSSTTNGACWLYHDGGNPWSKSGGDHDTTPMGSTSITATGVYSWNIEEIFKEWYSGSRVNHGLLLKGMQGSDSVKFFRTTDYTVADNRPYLEVKILTDLAPRLVNNYKKSIVIDEDSGTSYVHLDQIFEDPNGDPMTFSIWLNGWSTGPMDTENISASIEPNGTLAIRTKDNMDGYDTVWLNANDSKEDVTSTFFISIVQVNDPPVLKSISDKKGIQDVWINFSIRASDVDADLEGYWLTFGSNITGHRLTFPHFSVIKRESNNFIADVSFLPDNSHVGEIYIKLWVRDRFDAEANHSVKFSIKNQNDAPVIENILEDGSFVPIVVSKHAANMAGVQDDYLNFTVNVDDPDTITPEGETLEFWSNTTAQNFVLDKTNGEISFLPTNSDVGWFYARIYVSDYAGLQDYVDLRIKVRNIPDPPTITGVRIGESIVNAVNNEIKLEGVFSAMQDQYLNFTVLVSDSDFAVDDEENMRFHTNRSMDFNLILDQKTGEVIFLPGQEQVGMYYMRITVLDNEELEDDVTIIIHVLDANDLPPLPGLSVVVEEGSYTINAIVTSFPILDPDGDFLRCIWDFGDDTEPEMKIKDGEKWSAQHTYIRSGIYIVTLTLDDGRGGTVSSAKSITVGDVTIIGDIDEPASLGTQMSDESSSDIVLILMVLVIVIIVLVIAFFIYMRTGKKYEEVEEDEEDLLGDMYLPELGMYGGMPPGMGMGMGMGMQGGYGMGYGQYMSVPMQRNAMMPPHLGLPQQGMVAQPGPGYPAAAGPQFALPPAAMNAFCPQCGQQTLQPSTADPTMYLCTSCGFRSK